MSSELFPEAPRVIYRRNPLIEVICQVRFPPILRIDAEPPAAFQERVRRKYPLFRERSPDKLVELPPWTPRDLVEPLLRSIGPSLPKTYDFVSADETWRISLTREFLALTTNKYRRWEEFRERLSDSLAVLQEMYEPAFFTRVGLRYQDLIKRSALGLQDKSWGALLRPRIAGLLAEGEPEGAVREALSQVLLEFPGGAGKLRLRHGLARDGEECYLIDSDFFQDVKTEIDDALGKLDWFNQQARRFFRWCITDELHRALGPESVD